MSIPFPFTTPVRGVSQYSAEVASCQVGDPVLIRHEPENPFDKNACIITVRNETIGYLPAPLAARMVQSSNLWIGVISDKIFGQFPGVRITITGKASLDLIVSSIIPEPRDVKNHAPSASIKNVKAKSGRILGEFVREAEGVVFVDTGRGQVPYPADLVNIG